MPLYNSLRWRTLFSQTAEALVANGTVGTTETTLIAAGVGSTTIPVNFFVSGGVLRVLVGGRFMVGFNDGTMTLRLRMKKGSTVIADSAAFAPATFNSGTDGHHTMTAHFMASSATSIFGHALFQYTDYPAAAPVSPLTVPLAVAGATGTTVSSSAEAFNVTAQWGSTSFAAYIHARILTVEAFGA